MKFFERGFLLAIFALFGSSAAYANYCDGDLSDYPNGAASFADEYPDYDRSSKFKSPYCFDSIFYTCPTKIRGMWGTPSRLSRVLGSPDQNFFSMGTTKRYPTDDSSIEYNGWILLEFTDNVISTSGDSKPDFVVCEKKPTDTWLNVDHERVGVYLAKELPEGFDPARRQAPGTAIDGFVHLGYKTSPNSGANLWDLDAHGGISEGSIFRYALIYNASNHYQSSGHNSGFDLDAVGAISLPQLGRVFDAVNVPDSGAFSGSVDSLDKLALLYRDTFSGKPVVYFKDQLTGETLKQIYFNEFDADVTPIAITLTDDIDNNGYPEITVTAEVVETMLDAETGEVVVTNRHPRAIIKDLYSEDEVSDFALPSMLWQ